jgi:hypothetical protein
MLTYAGHSAAEGLLAAAPPFARGAVGVASASIAAQNRTAAASVAAGMPGSIRPHTSAYVSIRQHTSAYVSIRQHTSAYVSIRQHTSAIRQHTSAYVSIRLHTSAYVSIRQHTSAYV